MNLTKSEAIALLIYIYAVTALFAYFSFQDYLYNIFTIIPGFVATYPSGSIFVLKYWISVVGIQFLILLGMKIKYFNTFFTPTIMELGNILIFFTWLPMLFQIVITYFAQGLAGELMTLTSLGGTSIELYVLFLMLSFASFLFVFRKIRKHYWVSLGIVSVLVGVYFVM